MLLAALHAGCAGAKATRGQLLARAAFDLDCEAARLRTIEIDERTTGVRGCGRKATYVENRETGVTQYGSYRHNCTWVMNTDARPAVERPETPTR